MITIVIVSTLLFVLVVFAILYGVSLIGSLVRNVPHVATFGEYKHLLYKELPAILKDSEYICDLGSGTGRVARYMAQLGKRVDGYEIDPLSVIIARVINFFQPEKTRGITLSRKDFFRIPTSDLQKYDTFYIYLFPHLMPRVKREIIDHLKPGTKLIVNSFQFQDLQPLQSLKNKKGREIIWVYEV